MTEQSATSNLLIKSITLIVILGMVLLFIKYCFIDRPIDGLSQAAESTVEHIEKIASKACRTIETVFNGNDSASGPVTIIMHYPQQVAKLVTVQHEFEYEYLYTTTWLNSTKSIAVKAKFKAHGGLDVSGKKIRINIANDGTPTTVQEDLRGTGTLIACEQIGPMTAVEDDGLWNKITEEDRTLATNRLIEAAHNHAEKEMGIQRKAEENFINFIMQRSEQEKNTPLIPVQLN